MGVVIFYIINFKKENKVIYERRFEENKKARIQLFKKIAPRQKKHLVQKPRADVYAGYLRESHQINDT